MKKQYKEITWFTELWVLVGLMCFVSGMTNQNWFQFIGGMFMLWATDSQEVVIWQGKQSEGEYDDDVAP